MSESKTRSLVFGIVCLDTHSANPAFGSIPYLFVRVEFRAIGAIQRHLRTETKLLHQPTDGDFADLVTLIHDACYVSELWQLSIRSALWISGVWPIESRRPISIGVVLGINQGKRIGINGGPPAGLWRNFPPQRRK